MKSTRQEYIQDMEHVTNEVSAIGARALNAVKKAMHALLTGDVTIAKEVMKGDDIIDDMTIDIEDACLLLIAKQQPIAHDLRLIATGFKIATDIERIGDHAYDIAKTVEAAYVPLDAACTESVRQLGECASQMVELSMRAYREQDLVLANTVRRMDGEMDKIFERTFYALSDFVTDEATRERRVTQLLFIARFLERIGDHAVNIAEWVIYLETGERVHSKSDASA